MTGSETQGKAWMASMCEGPPSRYRDFSQTLEIPATAVGRVTWESFKGLLREAEISHYYLFDADRERDCYPAFRLVDGPLVMCESPMPRPAACDLLVNRRLSEGRLHLYTAGGPHPEP